MKRSDLALLVSASHAIRATLSCAGEAHLPGSAAALTHEVDYAKLEVIALAYRVRNAPPVKKRGANKFKEKRKGTAVIRLGVGKIKHRPQ
jgi:hypothetical protein